jgi:hypothetical protein
LKNFSIIAEYVLISFEPDDSAELARLEVSNELEEGVMKMAKWIKPVQQCDPKQRTAHLILGVTSMHDANKILRNGLLITRMRVRARKLLQEPRRCLKCHKLGTDHLAATCSQEHDVCGTCAGNHCTAECAVRASGEFRYANCKIGGHATWSRDCPEFRHYNEHFQARFSEHQYQFFPLSSYPSMWQKIDGFRQEGAGVEEECMLGEVL